MRHTGAAPAPVQCRTSACTSRRSAGSAGSPGVRSVTARVRRRSKSSSCSKTSASFEAKWEKSVVTATSASAATSRIPTASYPCSMKRRSAVSAIFWRVAAFLRSRRPVGVGTAVMTRCYQLRKANRSVSTTVSKR